MAIKYPDYTNSIMNVSNTFLHHYGIKTRYNGIDSLERNLESNPDHIIYILLDGLGSNVVKKHLDKSEALHKYMVQEVTSVFPPTTVAATNSVLSGQPPISTGYLGWVQYFEQVDANVTVFINNDFYNKDKFFDYTVRDRYLSYPSILDQINEHNEDVNASSIFPKKIGGTSTSFKDAIDQALLKVHNQDKTFTYVYWIQPDLIEHIYGIDSKETIDIVKDLNKDFESLLDNIPDNTMVVAIADHGLTDVEEVFLMRHKKLMSYLYRLPSIEPRATNFFVKTEHLNDFYDEFNRIYGNDFMLLTKEEFLDEKLLGVGPKHNLIDMFLGDYIAIAKSNILFNLNGSKTYKAHHAGLLEDEMMVPLVIYKK